MVVRSKRIALSVALLPLALGCGPKPPPRQVDLPDPVESSEPAPSTGPSASNAASSGEAPGKGPAAKASGFATFTDGLSWGMTHAELTKLFADRNGVIAKDYDEKLARARVGPDQTALEAERERVKLAFGRSYVEFKDIPTGYDSTAIRGEYTYRNNESLMWVERQGKKRYFFFINDRLWKLYDEVPLAAGGPVGKTFADAVNHISEKLGTKGEAQPADPTKKRGVAVVEWSDEKNQLRAIDRSRDKVVAIVVEDKATLANLEALRAVKPEDPNALDPSISSVTSGANRSDPNAPTQNAASSTPSKKASPPKRKP